MRKVTDQRPKASDQHVEAERLTEIVIGADIERFGLVQVALFGGQHKNRCGHAQRPQFPTHGETVHIRHHQIGQNHIRQKLLGFFQAHLTIFGLFNDKTQGSQEVA